MNVWRGAGVYSENNGEYVFGYGTGRKVYLFDIADMPNAVDADKIVIRTLNALGLPLQDSHYDITPRQCQTLTQLCERLNIPYFTESYDQVLLFNNKTVTTFTMQWRQWRLSL